MVNVMRGDVVLCNLSPGTGTEQAGIRPAVIVQIDRAIGHLDDVYMEELAKALATILGLPLV